MKIFIVKINSILTWFFVLSSCGIIVYISEHIVIDKKEFIRHKIYKYEAYINKYCNIFDIRKEYFVSTIFAELFLNYNYLDKFDEIRARIGTNPSVGLCQIKVSTFMWIEEHSTTFLIKKSNDFGELIEKMFDPQTNIKYACYYLKIIKNEYIQLYGKFPNLLTLASYYGRGIDNSNQIDSSYFNQLGKTAVEYFNKEFRRP